MPSSKKKQTKAQPRLPSSDPRGSSQTPSSLIPSPSSSDLELTEYDLSTALQAASEKYPRLIGKSAFIGRVSEVETDPKGCKIWLSEPSMLASSIAPGSLVSVSLASSSRQIMLGFPLSSFAEECLRNTGTDTGDKMVKEPGNFFALATVFPSSKVFKNGVRLSANLSYTMGCPTSGRALFVYAVQIPDLGGLVNQTNNLQSIGAISVQNCKELCLELASESEFTTKETVQSLGRPPVVKSQNEAGSLASPRTPVCHSKIGSPISGQFSSPTCEGLSSCPPSQKISPFDSFDIVQLLEDEKTKNLLNACTKSWLYSRCLLQGNLVIVPVLSKLWFFRVIGDQQAPSKAKNQCITDDRIQGLSPEVSCLQDHLNRAFVVTSGTNICLSLPRTSAFVNPGVTGSPGVWLQHAFCEAETGGDDLSLGGLDKEYSVLKDVIVSSCVKNTLSRFGLRATKGVLLHGPPGTGKTSLARLCSRDAGVSLLSVNGPEIVSQYYGESEQALRDVFDSACRAAPAVVFIDELDAIAPARREGGDELSQRMVGALLSLMDGINGTDGIFVIAATNRPESVEPALRRPGRFDREIHIGVPSPKQRLEILFTLLSRVEHSLSTLQIQQLAMVTHGFVGADLAALCNEAVLGCIRRYDKFKKSCENPRSQLPLEIELGTNSVVGSNAFEDRRDAQLDCLSSSFSATQASSDNLPSYRSKKPVVEDEDRMQTGVYCSKGLMDRNFLLRVSFEDFEKARTKVRPSAMREVILEVPKVKWEDIGGQREVKAQLMEAVEWPQKHQDALHRLGIHPPRGVLLFGPPGCSKTLLARAVASEAGLNFIAVKGPQLFSKWVGESEKAVKSVFAKARANAPSIIFFDEIDGLAVTRGRENDGVSVSDRVITQLLVELDGLHQRVDVTVIAATNRPDKIDPALLRPGRFDRLLYVGLPNEADREEIFHIHLRKTPCSSDVNVKELAHLTEGCIGADISFICRQATVAAMEEKSEATEVAMKHFKEAIDQVRPSELKFFEELSAQFQRLVLSRDK